MSPPIGWGITGAGHFLKETFEVMNEAVKGGFKITAYLTAAGEQVVKIYGLWNHLKEISDGSYLQEILVESEEGSSSPRAGRLLRGTYKAFIVSPASGNTVAKVVHGVADTLVTNAVAQAQKGGTPIYMVPTDQRGFIETTLPYRVDRNVCKLCKPCPVISICPQNAVKVLDGFPSINLSLCQGCKLCIDACVYGAVKHGEKVKLRVREIDVENVERLKKMDGITVLEHPRQIRDVLRKL
ncbi:MAG: dihydromethanopterin reductase (acceptor) [Candidatus Bathyarchaeia archaeon]